MKIIAMISALLIAGPALAIQALDEESAIHAAIEKCQQTYPGTQTDITKWIARKQGSHWEVCEITTGVACTAGKGMRVSVRPDGKAAKCEAWVTVIDG